jgi:ParB family transcriptional regulator, chromosome partitioning protein
MNIDHIPLDRLSVSKANMRAGKKPPDIADILPSIVKRGVISPVFIRPNCTDGHFEIVAGKRRYYASLEAARQGKDDVTLPCITLGEGDDADALEISMIENMLRQAPDQVTQWESYTRLVKEGRSVEDIAATFALTELQVKRILALGNLLPRIREAFRAEEIDAPTVKHLTLATKAQQKAWLALFEDKDGYAPRGSQLKAWLFGGASISTSMALFDLADFDGPIVKDFFEEDGYFADADQFWAAQGTEIERRKAAYLEDGWSSVEIIAPGTHFNDWQYEKTPKRKGGRVYIQVKAKGEVIFHEGYLTDKEARHRDDTANGTIKQPAPTRPEITSAMTSYIDLHRHAAVRSAMATQPSLALRVMVAHAICGSPLWRVEVQDQRSRNAAVTESIETCVAEARFDERRRAVLEVLGFDPESPEVTKGHEPEQGITGLFARLLEIPDRTVMEVLAIVMAETLASGTCLIESIGLHIGIDMADYWVADDAFYSLIRDREVLTAILREVGGDAVAQAHVAEKGKTIKSVINDFLTGENGRAKREHWVPRWMALPPTAYTERGGVAMVAASNRVRWQAEAEVPLDPDPAAMGAVEVVESGDAETADAFEEAEEQRLAA